jgi:hypothetical protein
VDCYKRRSPYTIFISNFFKENDSPSLREFRSLITSSIGARLIELLGVEIGEFRRVTVFGGAQARSGHKPVKYGNYVIPFFVVNESDNLVFR